MKKKKPVTMAELVKRFGVRKSKRSIDLMVAESRKGWISSIERKRRKK